MLKAKRTKEPGKQGDLLIAKRVLSGPDRLLYEVSGIFAQAGFEVIEPPPKGGGVIGDFWAEREELKKKRRYAIELKEKLSAREANAQLQRFRSYLRGSKSPFREFDEFWLVAEKVDSEARNMDGNFSRQFRVLDIKELQSILAVPPRSAKAKQGRATTKIGKAVEVNEKEINLAIAGLILQIDAKLEILRGELPNSDEGQSQVQRELTEFERMKAELERIRKMVAAFKKGKAPEQEQEVVKATKTFKQTVQGWWETGHEVILNTTAKSALFVSSVSLLALMRADSPSAIAGAAAVIMGKEIKGAAKKVGSAAKRIGKQIFAPDDGAMQ
jgi:hypothetical protein